MNIFDATISTNYVYLLSGGEVAAIFPTASVIGVVSKPNLQGFSINPMQAGEYKEYAWSGQIDWANCIPAPSGEDIATSRNTQMKYLCQLFPATTSGSIVSTAKVIMQTQQIGQLAAANRNYFASLNGTMVHDGNDNANCILPACTIKEVFFNVFDNNISTIATVSLLLNGKAVAHVDIPANTTGLFSLGSLSVSVDTTDEAALKISALSGSGNIHFSPITTILIIT